jgi:amino acid transporter
MGVPVWLDERHDFKTCSRCSNHRRDRAPWWVRITLHQRADFHMESSTPWLSHPYQFTVSAAQPLVTVIIAVTVINYFSVRTVGRFQTLLTTLKVTGVVAIVILGQLPGKAIAVKSGSLPAPVHSPMETLLMAVVPVMLAYNGFQWLGNVGGEIVSPRTNLPRAAILGTSLVVVLYVLVNGVYFHILGFSIVAGSEQFLPTP